MIADLSKCSEIAVDLEHHAYRSYLGFTCLIQISSRSQDYIIDTLALREELYKFNVVTTDPKIVKVFHGGQADILWLQKDFGVYVVNMFDTFHASQKLALPKERLLYLRLHDKK
jgi:exosome complex exonuclease RRP6